MKGQALCSLPVLFLFSVSAHAQASGVDAGGAMMGRILVIPVLAFLIWQLVRHFNKKAAYNRQREERRKLRAAQAEEDRMNQPGP